MSVFRLTSAPPLCGIPLSFFVSCYKKTVLLYIYRYDFYLYYLLLTTTTNNKINNNNNNTNSNNNNEREGY